MDFRGKKFIGNLIIVVLILSIGLLVFSYFSNGIIYSLITNDLPAITEYVTSFKYIAPIAFILLIVLEVVFAPIPPLMLYITGGILFGSFWGGTYALVGNILGAGMAFQISRHWARDFIEHKISPERRKRFDNFSKKHGPLSIFILRVNPLTTSDIFSYIAGLTKMNFVRFIISTGIALAPMIYFQSYIGDFTVKYPILSKIFMGIGAIYVLIFIGIFIYVKVQKKYIKQEKNKNAKLSHEKR